MLFFNSCLQLQSVDNWSINTNTLSYIQWHTIQIVSGQSQLGLVGGGRCLQHINRDKATNDTGKCSLHNSQVESR